MIDERDEELQKHLKQCKDNLGRHADCPLCKGDCTLGHPDLPDVYYGSLPYVVHLVCNACGYLRAFDFHILLGATSSLTYEDYDDHVY